MKHIPFYLFALSLVSLSGGTRAFATGAGALEVAQIVGQLAPRVLSLSAETRSLAMLSMCSTYTGTGFYDGVWQLQDGSSMPFLRFQDGREDWSNSHRAWTLIEMGPDIDINSLSSLIEGMPRPMKVELLHWHEAELSEILGNPACEQIPQTVLAVPTSRDFRAHQRGLECGIDKLRHAIAVITLLKLEIVKAGFATFSETGNLVLNSGEPFFPFLPRGPFEIVADAKTLLRDYQHDRLKVLNPVDNVHVIANRLRGELSAFDRTQMVSTAT